MLDFYFIADNQLNNYALTAAEYIGGIRMHEFEQAQHAHIIEYHLRFYDDFRWSNAQVKQKLAQLHDTKSEQFDALQKILQSAIELNCGVIAFGD